MRSLARLPLFLGLAALLGCSKGEIREEGGKGRPHANGVLGAPAPLAGDRVVIENAMATFVEGVVASVSRDRARVLLGAAGDVSDRPLGDLYVPSSGEASDLREGGYAVCHMPDGNWRGCRIEALGSVVRVTDDESATFELMPHDVLAATPVTELNVRQRFERNARRRAFREGAKSAGRPRVPAGWRPEMNARVLVWRDGTWMGAQVKGSKKGFVFVQGDADRRPMDARVSDLAPEPPIEFVPMVGTFVLVRPAAGTHAWGVMRVEAAGTSNLELSDELGERHQAAIRDVMPLERGR
jgi:hypothetical protein